MRPVTALFLCLALLSSCGGSSDPRTLTSEGQAALGSGDVKEALGKFQAALEIIGDDKFHAEYLEAKMGAIEANATLDPEKARKEFLELARSLPENVDDRDYNRVATRMAEGSLPQAIKLLEAGMEAHPESPHLAKLRDTLGQRAEQSDDPEALKALEGLGYVGD